LVHKAIGVEKDLVHTSSIAGIVDVDDSSNAGRFNTPSFGSLNFSCDFVSSASVKIDMDKLNKIY
jgi:hypothetical protein